MIIDIHTHLGDILYPNGGELIDQKNVRKKIFFDVISLSESLLHTGISDAMDQWLYKKIYTLVTRASRARNTTATLENMRQSMDETGVVKIVKKACQGDKSLENRIFYENAAALLGI